MSNKCILIEECLDICARKQDRNTKYTLRKKGTKAVTGTVPFQKVHFCTY